MSLDLFLNSVQLVGKCLSSVLTFHSKHVLESLLLAAQNLNLFLVSVDAFGKLTANLCQVAQLALKMSSVVRSLCSAIHHATVHVHVGAYTHCTKR